MKDQLSISRTSARALILSDEGRVLLIRFVVERGGQAFSFWATPGGGVEPGESPREAVTRELQEELELAAVIDGPVHQTVAEFVHEDRPVVSTDIFFVARTQESALSLRGITPEERNAMREVRWWTPEEIERAAEPVFPPELASLVRDMSAIGAGPEVLS